MSRPWSVRCLLTLGLMLAGSPAWTDDPGKERLVEESFESGAKAPEGWQQGPPIPGVKYVYDQKTASQGDRSLSLQKSEKRYFPVAGWSRTFPHTSPRRALQVALQVKAAKATKAVVDVQFLGAGDELLQHEWAVYIGQKKPTDKVATHDWKRYEGSVAIPEGTKQIAIALQIYGPGDVWFDELEVQYVDAVGAAPSDATPPKAGSPDGGKTPAGKKKPTPQAPSGSPSAAADAPLPSPAETKTAAGGLARYILIPPTQAPQAPARVPLLLVLAGGDGSVEFHPFVRSLHEIALEGRFAVAHVIAPPHVVWPTRSSTTTWGTTGETLMAILDDVARQQPIDKAQVYALAWSSSGPAVYEALLEPQSPLAGAFIAMSVFRPTDLPPLTAAAGRRVYLLHSPDDALCPYRMAADARDRLTAAGADVKLVDYAGGHGWHGPVQEHLKTGIAWLQRPSSAPAAKSR